jgi:thiazole/oxazole-forming peptide maturase SagD family component
MRKKGPWKLPMGFGDYVQFWLLSLLIHWNWFSHFFWIHRSRDIDFAYVILLSYIQRQGIFDSLHERNLHLKGYYSYFLIKTIRVKHRDFVIRGQGVAQNKQLALSRAVGEMLERVISGLNDSREIDIVDSPEEMMKHFLIFYPPRYHRFLDIQKERRKELSYNLNSPMAWVKGRDLVTGEVVYLARDMTSWCSRLQQKNRKNALFVHATTNGAAGFFSKSGAVLRGLLEVVQRDAFLVHWLTMIAPDVIRHETLPETVREQIMRLESLGVSIYVLNTTALDIPSILIAGVHNDPERIGVTLTAASSLTLQESITDALREMVVAIEIFYSSDVEKNTHYRSVEPEPFISDLDRMTRQFYWMGSSRVEQFRWFISGKKVSYAESLQYDIDCEQDDVFRLKSCIQILGSRGSDYHPVVYYPENKIQTTLGFYVAQVYIPKAFPFYLFEGYGTFESDRLHEFAVSKGVHDWKLNPLPHGFS